LTRAVVEIERLTGEIARPDNDLVNLRRNLVGEDGAGGREAELVAARVARGSFGQVAPAANIAVIRLLETVT
jgi:hypothetical protein